MESEIRYFGGAWEEGTGMCVCGSLSSTVAKGRWGGGLDTGGLYCKDVS